MFHRCTSLPLGIRPLRESTSAVLALDGRHYSPSTEYAAITPSLINQGALLLVNHQHPRTTEETLLADIPTKSILRVEVAAHYGRSRWSTGRHQGAYPYVTELHAFRVSSPVSYFIFCQVDQFIFRWRRRRSVASNYYPNHHQRKPHYSDQSSNGPSRHPLHFLSHSIHAPCPNAVLTCGCWYEPDAHP